MAILVLVAALSAGSFLAYVRSRPREVVLSTGAAESSAPRDRILTVHVAGAVANPGLYRIAEGTRVADAISRAGGPVPDAVTDDINLAARVTDGQKITVPRKTPDQAPQIPGETPARESSTLVNINTAGPQELERLPGVGPAMAARIVEHRRKNGPFSSVDDLDGVQGIGPSKMEALRDLVTI